MLDPTLSPRVTLVKNQVPAGHVCKGRKNGMKVAGLVGGGGVGGGGAYYGTGG